MAGYCFQAGTHLSPQIFTFSMRMGGLRRKKKICLSFSAYHPEEWQPAWGVRTILEALISFMPSKSEGAIGGLNWTTDERKKCVKKSWTYSCQHCGLVKDLIPLRRSGTTSARKETPEHLSMRRRYPRCTCIHQVKDRQAVIRIIQLKLLQKKRKKTKVTGFETGKIAQRMYIRLPVRQTKSPMFNVTAM